MAKAPRHEFENTLINGDPAVDPLQPAGLYATLRGTGWVAATAYALGDVVVPTAGLENGFRYECTTAGTSHATAEPVWPRALGDTVADNTVVWTCRYGNHLGSGVDGAALTFSRLDELIDLVRGGKPDMLLMSKRTRRHVQDLARAAGSNLWIGEGKLGETIQLYNGIPIAVNDWIFDNWTVGASTDCSQIFAFQMGENGVCGLTSPEMIQLERLGSLETADAARTRVKWYVSLAVFSIVTCAMLTGVRA